MTMAMQQYALCRRREIDVQSSGGGFRGQEFLEQHHPTGSFSRRVAFEQRRNFVAKAEHAAWLKPNYRQAARELRLKCNQRALRLVSRRLGFADREKRAATAPRA